MRRARVALLVILSTLFACSRGGPAARVFPRAPVVLVSVDTLRSDHLPFYGYGGVETPALTALRKESILFEKAWSPVPLTLPAHTSLFTGLPPGGHGIHDNLGYKLRADVPTLAEVLRKAGYATGGAVSAVVLSGSSGVSRGFNLWEDSIEPTENQEALGRVQRPGDETEALLSKWVDAQGDKPFFAFLHVYEPHAPYEPREPFKSRFANPYDGEIATADAIVGRFLDRLKAKGIYDRALVVFLSDHGEGLGEHGEDEHGIFLYREALQVPLLVKLPKGAFAGTSVSTPVSILDVFGTVVRAVGITGITAAPDAVSLVDVAAGARAPERRLFAETFFPRVHFGWSDLASVVDGPWHYIDAPRPEIYDLARDPTERDNRVAEKPGPLRSMKLDLDKRRAQFLAPGPVDSEDAKKLASLGYLSTGATAGSGPLADPKDEIGLIRVLGQATSSVREGRSADAAAIYRSLLDKNPRMMDVWELYSEALLALGRGDEALAARRKMVELAPPTATHPLLSVANICLQLGRVDEALKHAQLAKDRGDAAADEVLARVFFTKGDFASAEAAARRAMETGKTRRRATLVYARILVARGELKQALDLVDGVRSALGSGVVPMGLHYVRGDILARLDRSADAQAEFLEEIRLYPSASVDARVLLALTYASERKMAEAHRVLAELVAAIPTPDAYLKAARTLEVIGDRAGAGELRRLGARRFPEEARLKSASARPG